MRYKLATFELPNPISATILTPHPIIFSLNDEFLQFTTFRVYSLFNETHNLKLEFKNEVSTNHHALYLFCS